MTRPQASSTQLPEWSSSPLLHDPLLTTHRPVLMPPIPQSQIKQTTATLYLAHTCNFSFQAMSPDPSSTTSATHACSALRRVRRRSARATWRKVPPWRARVAAFPRATCRHFLKARNRRRAEPRAAHLAAARACLRVRTEAA
eukprot:1191188-Prorocentrum_minimum.AAC.1